MLDSPHPPQRRGGPERVVRRVASRPGQREVSGDRGGALLPGGGRGRAEAGPDAQHAVGVTEAVRVLGLEVARLDHDHVQDHDGRLRRCDALEISSLIGVTHRSLPGILGGKGASISAVEAAR